MLICCACFIFCAVSPAGANVDLNLISQTHSFNMFINDASVLNITTFQPFQQTITDAGGTVTAAAGNLNIAIAAQSFTGQTSGGTITSSYVFQPTVQNLQFAADTIGAGPYTTSFSLIDNTTGLQVLSGSGGTLLNTNNIYTMNMGLTSFSRSNVTSLSVDIFSPGFGTGTGTGAVPAPEPATPALIGLVSYFLMRRRIK
jgi:hypothetical protein